MAAVHLHKPLIRSSLHFTASLQKRRATSLAFQQSLNFPVGSVCAINVHIQGKEATSIGKPAGHQIGTGSIAG